MSTMYERPLVHGRRFAQLLFVVYDASARAAERKAGANNEGILADYYRCFFGCSWGFHGSGSGDIEPIFGMASLKLTVLTLFNRIGPGPDHFTQRLC